MNETAPSGPMPFELHESGAYLHGTRAHLAVGDLLVPGRESNVQAGLIMKHVYVTLTLDAAVWGAELAAGEGRPRIYVVEPRGELEDDPNLTDKKFAGNPTQSFRTTEPVEIVGELHEWTGHSEVQQQAMRAAIQKLKDDGQASILN